MGRRCLVGFEASGDLGSVGVVVRCCVFHAAFYYSSSSYVLCSVNTHVVLGVTLVFPGILLPEARSPRRVKAAAGRRTPPAAVMCFPTRKGAKANACMASLPAYPANMSRGGLRPKVGLVHRVWASCLALRSLCLV